MSVAPGGETEEAGGGGVGGEWGGEPPQEQLQGLKFPAPGVVFVARITFSLRRLAWRSLCDPVADMASDKGGAIVPAESMSLGLKVETNGPASSN